MSKVLLFIDTNNPRAPRAADVPTYYNVNYEVSGPALAKARALQRAVDAYTTLLMAATTARMNPGELEEGVNEIWEELDHFVRLYAGGSAEPKQSEPDTEAATSTPSPGNSKKVESRSSMKRRAIQSRSKQGGVSAAPAAEEGQSG